MKLASLALAVAALSVASTAHAVTYSYSGTTAGGPTFTRPLAGTPPSGLSAVGVGVSYSALTFSVTASGAYDFLTSTTGAYDPFVILYAGSFVPSASLMNALVANDDLTTGNLNQSGFTRSLTAGSTYVYVTTGFDPTDFGTFSATITGPGSVVAVPEPETYGLMLLGLAGIGLAARRRSAPREDVVPA